MCDKFFPANKLSIKVISSGWPFASLSSTLGQLIGARYNFQLNLICRGPSVFTRSIEWCYTHYKCS